MKSGGNDYRPGGMPHPVRQVGHHEGFVTNPVYFE